MTDSRAALEEQLEAAWREARLCDDIALDQPLDKIISEVQEDRERLWAENRDLKQESSSLKLLLRAMCRDCCHLFNGKTEISIYPQPRQSVFPAKRRTFPVELDSSGIPVLTPEIIEALEAAK